MYIRYIFFFFNDTATTEIYTLSLHDALPISPGRVRPLGDRRHPAARRDDVGRADLEDALVEQGAAAGAVARSEEHTSELQSRQYLVCRLLLEKKKKSQA